ncbi:unnamed protein product [Lampetra fluviatilis]
MCACVHAGSMSGDLGRVFVTVGTTSFDELIETVSSDGATHVLRSLGYSELVLQVGRGALLPEPDTRPGFRLSAFRYKDSLAEDMQAASLVISHAGAGSCLEALGCSKPLVVVINEKLMDNHQLELAMQLQEDGHLFSCTCSTLVQTLREMDLKTLKPFPPGQPEKFAQFLDEVMGFT